MSGFHGEILSLKKSSRCMGPIQLYDLLWPKSLAGHGDQAKLELSLSLSHTIPMSFFWP